MEQPRNPRGPRGGQFAPMRHSDPDILLDDSPTSPHQGSKRNEVLVDEQISKAQDEFFSAARKLKFFSDRMEKDPTGVRYANEVDEAKIKYSETYNNLEKIQREYTGWSRFFLVSNINGHIHSNMNCSTCRPTTQFGWLTELSGLSEADAVDEYGSILCSVCFPSAPSEWTNGENKKLAAERDLERALKEIEKSPEGRTVKAKRSNLHKWDLRIQIIEGSIERARFKGADESSLLKDLEAARRNQEKASMALQASQEALDAALGIGRQ